MTDDELELGILKRFVAQHKAAAMLEQQDKCARELDMRAVVQELTGLEGKELDYEIGRWYEKLALGRNAPLRFCTDSTRNKGDHRYHARAFRMRGTEPAWERIRELEAVLALSRPPTLEREFEQKFRILWSPGQALADFTRWIDSGSLQHSGVGVLFIDIDDFKSLNTQFTEVRVDRDLLVPFQVLLDRLTMYRGYAYKYGGDEFVIQLPNHTIEEVLAFANRLRETVSGQVFDMGGAKARVTVSIGVAQFPEHGDDYAAVLEAASRAKQKGGKDQGKNRVAVAP